MSTRSAEASIVIQARDKATGQFRKVAMESQRLGGAWRILTAVLRQMNIGMLAMATVLPVVGAALASIVTVAATVSFLKWEQAARRARIQLQFMGFSASESRQQMDMLASTMSRANAQVMFQSAGAMADVAVAGQGMTAQLAPMADTFADLIGASPADVFSALFDIFAKQDPTKFERLVAGTENIAIPIGMITALEKGDFAPFLTWFHAITNKESLTQMEQLTENLARLGALTAPAAETISEATAGFANVFVSSFATRMENLQEEIKLMLAGGIAAALIAGAETEAMTGAYKKFGTRMGAGIAAALAIGIVLDLKTTWETLSNNWEVLGPIVIAAMILGKVTGRWWVAAAAAIFGLELAPGIADAMQSLGTEKSVNLVVAGLGVAMGLMLKKKLTTSLALGVTLSEIMKSLYTGEGDSATLRQNIVKVTAGALGAAIGFAYTRSWTGAIFGAGIALAIEDSIDEPVVKKAAALAGFAYLGYMVGAMRGRGGVGLLVGALVGLAYSIESSEAIEAFKQLGIYLGKGFVDGTTAVINDLIRLLNNITIKQINRIPGVNIPLIDEIPRPFMDASLMDILPKSYQTPDVPSIEHGRRESFDADAIIPVPSAGPRYFRYGEIPSEKEWKWAGATDLRTSQRNGLTVVQMVVDKRVLGEIAIDALGNVAQFQGGLHPGSVAGA
jgi:hypothetical protein